MTKKLYLVVWRNEDGEDILLATFDSVWLDELRGRAAADLLGPCDPGMDAKGFGWYELNVPHDSTLTELGLGLDATVLYPVTDI